MVDNVKKYYRGFSSKNYHDTGQGFELYNVELINEDLLNQIFTIKGERVMMPEFGTRIPLLVFEINDETTQDIIETDLKAVFKYDPRVELITLVITPAEDQNLITATATLKYIEFNVTSELHIEVRSQ